MKWNVISRLKTTFTGAAPQKVDIRSRSADRLGSVEQEPSARDYEFYYWCSTPAPWY